MIIHIIISCFIISLIIIIITILLLLIIIVIIIRAGRRDWRDGVTVLSPPPPRPEGLALSDYYDYY